MRPGAAGLAAVLVAGIVLRLAWPADIEWKGDERFTFEAALALAAGGAWPWTGMPTSLGPPNPGFSVWIFGALAWLSGAATPPALAQAVQAANALTLLGMLAFALRTVPAEERETWLWALALLAVNPLVVVVERKIWPPSVLPPIMLGFFWGWYARHRRLGAFAWGACGALAAQLHLASAPFALAIAGWTLAGARRSARWTWWLAGSALASLPALPWLAEVAAALGGGAGRWRWPNFTLYLRWLTQPLGWGADYSLGAAEFRRFLRWPEAGVPSFAVGILHAVAIGAGLTLAARALRARAAAWPGWRRLALGTPGRASMLVAASLLGHVAVLSLSTFNVHRHYLVVAAVPMMLSAVLLAFAGERGPDDRRATRALLAVLVAANAAIAAALLAYIHAVQVIPAEYGATWRAQQP